MTANTAATRPNKAWCQIVGAWVSGRLKPFLRSVLPILFILTFTGCMVLPVPSVGKRETVWGKKIQAEDLAFVRLGETSWDEITNRFGKPWNHYPDLRIAVYYWEVKTGNWFAGICLPGIGGVISGTREAITRSDVLLIQFDEQNRVIKFEILKHPEKTKTKDLAARWGHQR